MAVNGKPFFTFVVLALLLFAFNKKYIHKKYVQKDTMMDSFRQKGKNKLRLVVIFG